MNRKVIFLLVYIFVLVSCQEQNDIYNVVEGIDQKSLRIRIIPEDTLGGYVLEWDDGIQHTKASERDLLITRPYEIHCYVLNSSFDTLGYYVGSSSPRQYAYFFNKKINENIVLIKFRFGLNAFSSYFDNIDQDKLEKAICAAEHLPKYKEVIVDLNKNTRNWSTVDLIEE